jgi:hypothetical protein
LEGSLEHTIHILVAQKMDLSMFDCRYKNDETGCKAYDPKILLKREHKRRHHQVRSQKRKTRKREKQRRSERLNRLRSQANRIKEWLKTHEPKIGKQGKEIQSNVTDHESAKMSTSHGVLQGYHGQALVDGAYQVIVHAEAFGNGQDYDHVAPMMAGAKATMQALGYGEDYFAGRKFLADSNYHSDGNLKSCEEERKDAFW